MTSILTALGHHSRRLNLARELHLELLFRCQIDEKIHSALKSTYRCNRCGIYVCGGCFLALTTVVGFTACPHCYGALTFELSLIQSFKENNSTR